MYVGNAVRLHLNGNNYLAMCMGNAVRHLMSVASHAETPLDVLKWLERENCGGKRPAVGRRYFKIVPYLKARFFACGILYPSHLLSLAIANSDRWFAVPIGHGCMAGYGHLMPMAFPLINTNKSR